ncbi:CotH kinase family protein [Saccharicrinis sp. FJH2]|uniref:CotH kinase family protein n=1 Tax=Saccharicrinis sp. FJH65 TaxID=3344659 RepID=UPI0035F25806
MIKLRYILFFLCIVISASSQELIRSGTEYKYYKGSQSPGSANEWTQLNFNDQSWTEGLSPFWYGDGSNGTVLDDMQNNYSSFYLRTKIEIDSLTNVEDVSLFLNYDDGFNLFINGHLTISENAPQNPVYNSFATALHESGNFENYIMSPNESFLKAGENIIAVQVFNYNLTSSDIHFDLSLKLRVKEPEIPRTQKVEFSHAAGFYDTPFDATITTKTLGDRIRYTLDCSDPQTSPTAIETTSPVTVKIDPDATGNRPRTPGVILRACAISDSLAPSWSGTVSYIFPDKVKTQNYPGGQWPSQSVNSQIFDYAMDPDVVNSSVYKNQIELALTDIPSMSLVTSTDNLVNASYGIYVNAGIRGPDWERAGSLELFNTPNEEEGFQVNTGIRIRGGWSRHPDNPKHAFRLFFRSEYGNPKLEYPLFGVEGTDSYDKIDLRTSQNYSWSYKGDKFCTMNRDVFSRDLQREMNQPYTRSRYYHLYLNGMYWGLYQTQERAEARFAESYFGGDKDDYDVVKVNTQNYSSRTIEATDGNLEKWDEVYNLFRQGFKNDANYYKLQGRDSGGKIDTSMEVLVDIDNLIDYMLVIFYTGNFDSPYSKFGNFINNFYNIRNRTYKRNGFQFLIHDAEHSILAYPASPGIGPTEDRVNITINVPDINSFQAQSLHNKLSENELYRHRFADRAYTFLYNNGVLTPERCKALFLSRADDIQYAIIGESARWGDSKSSVALTKADWQGDVQDIVDRFLEVRTDILISQLKTADLLPETEAPELYMSVQNQAMQKVNGLSLSIVDTVLIMLKNTNGTGSIVLTTNGEDPISVNGTLNPNAISTSEDTYTLKVSETTEIKSRILNSDETSPLRTVHVLDTKQPDDLRLTEIHYNPDDLAGKSGKNYEFIELKNIGDQAINISDLVVSGGINFTFNAPQILQAGQFAVLVSNPYLFEYAYQKTATGWFSGNLSNGGEQVILATDYNHILGYVSYGIDSPWPNIVDLAGYSLVPSNPNPETINTNGENWIKSSVWGGTPFADNSSPDGLEFTASNTHTNITIYPNPTSDFIVIKSNKAIHNARLSLHDLNGKRIFEKANVDFSVGNNFILSLSALNISNGIYLINISSGSVTEKQRVIYIQ